MRKAIIDDAGAVLNVIVVPDDWTGASGEWQPPAGTTVIDALDAAPGDTWDGESFVRPDA